MLRSWVFWVSLHIKISRSWVYKVLREITILMSWVSRVPRQKGHTRSKIHQGPRPWTQRTQDLGSFWDLGTSLHYLFCYFVAVAAIEHRGVFSSRRIWLHERLMTDEYMTICKNLVHDIRSRLCRLRPHGCDRHACHVRQLTYCDRSGCAWQIYFNVVLTISLVGIINVEEYQIQIIGHPDLPPVDLVTKGGPNMQPKGWISFFTVFKQNEFFTMSPGV